MQIKNDTELNLLIQEAEQHIERRDPSSLKLTQDLIEYTNKSKNITYIIQSRYILAYYYCLVENNYDKAINTCYEVINKYSKKEVSPVSYKICMALGNSYQMKGDVFSAQTQYLQGLRILEKQEILNKTEKAFLASFYYNLSLIMGASELNIQAENYLTRSIEVNEEIGSLFKLSLSYSAYAAMLERKKEYEKAIEVMLKALQLNIQVNDTYTSAISKANLGILYFRTSNPLLASLYLDEALGYFEDNNMLHEVGLVKYNKGEVMCAMGDYAVGIPTLYSAEKIFIKLDNKKELLNVYQALSNYLAIRKEFQRALEYHQKYVQELKQIFDIEKTNSLTRAKEEFESELSAKEAAMLRDKNEQINKHVLNLETVNKDLELFSYSVSHDLRSPLRSISGFAKLLVKKHSGNLNEEAKEYLEYINNSAIKMGHLIDELLQFSKVGKISVNCRQTDMNRILNVVITEFKAVDPEIDLKISIDDLIPCYCDPSLIKQVWENLVSNAIKYSSKKDNPQIYIGSSREDGVIQYFIRDNGVGFDMKHVGNLFGVFRRLHTDSEFEGTGIGLAFVHRIITKHGGDIWAEAEINVGACFFFTLPNHENFNKASVL